MTAVATYAAAAVSKVIARLKRDCLAEARPYRGVFLTEKGSELAEKVEAETSAIVQRARGIEAPNDDDFFTSMYAELPPDLRRQMDTRRTSSIGEDPSQIENPQTA